MIGKNNLNNQINEPKNECVLQLLFNHVWFRLRSENVKGQCEPFYWTKNLIIPTLYLLRLNLTLYLFSITPITNQIWVLMWFTLSQEFLTVFTAEAQLNIHIHSKNIFNLGSRVTQVQKVFRRNRYHKSFSTETETRLYFARTISCPNDPLDVVFRENSYDAYRDVTLKPE